MAKRLMNRKSLEKTSRKKEKAKITRLVKSLDWICRHIILIRDKHTCQKCGAEGVDGQNAQTSHVIPKSKGWALRWDLTNLKLLCYHCHLGWWHKNPIEAYEWFKNKFPERFKYLEEHKNDIVKRSAADYEEMEKLMKCYLEELNND